MSFVKVPKEPAQNPGVDAAVRDLRACFVAYQRHKEEDSLQTVWDYWELMGSEKYENGEVVFRRYIWSRLTYVDKHGSKWLGAKIRRHFREAGFNLYDEGFRDFPSENPADSKAGAGGDLTIQGGDGGAAEGRHDGQNVDKRNEEEVGKTEDAGPQNESLFQEKESRHSSSHACGGPGRFPAGERGDSRSPAFHEGNGPE